MTRTDIAMPIVTAPSRVMACIAASALLLLVFTSNIIPIGTLFGIPFRVAIYAVAIVAMAWLLAFARGTDIRGVAAFGALLFGVILLATLNGLGATQTPDAFVLDDLRTYVVTFSIALLTMIAYELGVVSARSLMVAFVLGTLIYATLKVVFFTALIFTPDSAMPFLTYFFEHSEINIVFGLVAPGISRIQSGLDFSAIVSIVFLSLDRDKTIFRRRRRLAMSILAAGVIITFSRTLVVLLLVVFVALLVFNSSRRQATIGLVALTVVLGVFGIVAAEPLAERINSGQQGDMTRVAQSDGLLDLWEQSPWVGEGIGAYSRVVYRDSDAPYNYELQLHSIATKLGLFGWLFLVVITAVAIADTVREVPRRIVGWPVGLLAAFLFAGSTNPYIFSSAAANVYIAFFIGFRLFCARDADGPANLQRAIPHPRSAHA